MTSNKKPVLAFITTGLSTGGAEVMLYRLLSRINREKYTPAVISLMDCGTFGEQIKELNVPVYTVGMAPAEKPSIMTIWRLLKTVNNLNPDLLQGWMYHGNLAASVVNLFSFKKIPVTWAIHHSITGLSSEKSMTRKIIKFGGTISQYIDKVVFVSQNSKLQHEALGYNQKITQVIPNGFDTSLFKPSLEERLSLRKELGLANDSLLIGLVCRYHPMKDHINFLQAAALLVKEYPQVSFILAGTNVDYNNQTLVQLIKSLGIFNQVYLLGERSDTPRIMAALDIMSTSSAYGEAFPLVVGEAMSCGVPCVVTDVGDSAWIVGNTGKAVPPKNSGALANAWKDLIEMGTPARQILGQAARLRIIEFFSLDYIVLQFEGMFDSLLTQRHKIQDALIRFG